MDKTELAAILAAHGAWVRGDKDGKRADLSGADLRRADLNGADLSGAYLSGADLPAFGPVTLPDWTFRAYKLAKGPDGERVIVTLEIPEDAQRVAPLVGRKCRTSHARVVALSAGESATSWHKPPIEDGATPITYRVGQTVTAHKYDPSPFVECAGGIHFYLARREAEEH